MTARTTLLQALFNPVKQKKRKKFHCSSLAVVGTIRVIETEIPLLVVLDSARTRNNQVHEFEEAIRLNDTYMYQTSL